MSGIIDGQQVNATDSNAAWLAKNGDDTTIGRVSLSNTAADSGSNISNAQREFNSLASKMGVATNEAKDALVSFTNNEGLTASESIKSRVEELSAFFNHLTGHNHDGSNGSGANINSQSIGSVILKAWIIQGTQIPTISSGSSSTDITSLMGGLTASTNSATKGVVVNSPYNKVILTDSNGNEIIKPLTGEVIYGRVTYSASIWTISYYYITSGVETAFTFATTYTNVQWYYQDLINPISDAGFVYSPQLFTPSTNATAEVVDASATQRGLVNTSGQTFGGVKTFSNGIINGGTIVNDFENDSTSGALVTLNTPVKGIKRLTNAGLVSVQTITAPSNNQFFVLSNNSTGTIIIKNGTGNLITGIGIDLNLVNGASLWFWFDTVLSAWVCLGGSGSGGVASVTASGVVASSGGINPNISITAGTNKKVLQSNSSAAGWAEIFLLDQFISNYNFDNGTVSGWATYADAAGTTPVDGTLGSPTHISISAVASTFFNGSTALQVSNSGSTSAQGEGFSFDFSLPGSLKTKVLKLEASYLVSSGTFSAGSNITDSDLKIFVYDVTNATLIHPNNNKFLSASTSLAGKISSTFQVPSNSTSYRLIFHVPTTNTAAWTLLFGNFSLQEQKSVGINGPAIVDATSVTTVSTTPTQLALTSVTDNTGLLASNSVTIKDNGYYDIYNNIQVSGTAAATTGVSYIYLNGASIRSITSSTTAASQVTTCECRVVKFLKSGDVVTFYGSSSAAASSSASVGLVSYSDAKSISEFDGRSVSEKYYLTANFTSSSTIPFNFDGKESSSHGSVTPSATTWKFIAPFTFEYTVKIYLQQSAAASSYICIYKNGVRYKTLDYIGSSVNGGSSSTDIQLNANDYIDIRAETSSTWTGGTLGTVGVGHIEISSRSGQSSILQGQRQMAEYYWTANQGITANTTVLNPDGKITDTMSAVTTGAAWKFEAQNFGDYHIQGVMNVGPCNVYMKINGVAKCYVGGMSAASASLGYINKVIQLNAKDYIQFFLDASVTITGGSSTGGYFSTLSIKQVN